MSEFELDNKSEMIYINEDANEDANEEPKKKPFIVKQDPVTGDWNATIVKMDENNNENEIKQEEDDIQESETDDIQESETDDIQESETDDIQESETDDIQESETYDIQESETDDIQESETDEHKNSDNKFLSCEKFHHNKFVTRSHFSNMMFSHISMIIPCIWWICIDFPKTDNDILYSKLMSIIMTAAVIFSYLYHYYYECILCNAENTYMLFAISCLNIYMYLRNVSIFYILVGSLLLITLDKYLKYCNSRTVDFYETFHPFCHYIAGLYIYYCVWNLQNAQQNICNTASTGVIFNDVYSGVNYHTMQK
jgi:hypothetical protein